VESLGGFLLGSLKKRYRITIIYNRNCSKRYPIYKNNPLTINCSKSNIDIRDNDTAIEIIITAVLNGRDHLTDILAKRKIPIKDVINKFVSILITALVTKCNVHSQ
jgi:hypothetical protein